MPSKKSDQQIVNKIERYCAFQERCRQDVSIKLQQFGITDDSEKEKIISLMEKNGFVDEARYAKAFSRDKFNLNGWGKIKIGFALQQKSVPQKFIYAGLAAIDDSEYMDTLKSLLRKKDAELKSIKDSFIRKNRVANYMAGKGFEPDLIWKLIG